MSMECEKFLEQSYSSVGGQSADFAAHLAICPACQKNLEIVNSLQKSRAPLDSSEMSEIFSIVNSSEAGAIIGMASAKATTASFGVGKISFWIAALLLLVPMAYFALFFESSQSIENSFSDSKGISIPNAVIDAEKIEELESLIARFEKENAGTASEAAANDLLLAKKMLVLGKELAHTHAEITKLLSSSDSDSDSDSINKEAFEKLMNKYDKQKIDFVILINSLRETGNKTRDWLSEADFPVINLPATGEEENAF